MTRHGRDASFRTGVRTEGCEGARGHARISVFEQRHEHAHRHLCIRLDQSRRGAAEAREQSRRCLLTFCRCRVLSLHHQLAQCLSQRGQHMRWADCHQPSEHSDCSFTDVDA
eukprot:6203746-Pleurochrysis_carterae.AAC.1